MFARRFANPKSGAPQRSAPAALAPAQAPVARTISNQGMVQRRPQRAGESRHEPGAQGAAWDSNKVPAGRGQRFQGLPANQSTSFPLQAKLAAGQVDDPLEREADRVAHRVMRMPASGVSRQCAACDKVEKLQKKPAGPGSAASDAPPIVHDVLRSPGQPLDAATRAYFEPRFGHDLSGVRVHTDAAAAQSAQAVNANAYTVGKNIVFGSGRFVPGTQAGRQLLAHELTHVVQQAGGGAPPGPAHERDANTVSRAVEMGARPQVRTSSRVGLAAQPKPGMAGGEALGNDFENAGLRIVTFEEITARVNRIMKTPGIEVREGRADFNASPARANANLNATHFRNDDARLSYAMGAFEEALGIEGKGVNSDELYGSLWNYELQAQRQTADLIVHTPPTTAERQQLVKVRAEYRAKQEKIRYDSYLAEVARLDKEAAKRMKWGPGGPSGAATVDAYQQFIGPFFEDLANRLPSVAEHMTSLMMNFIPIVGQLKGIAEAIVGQDLITGDKLPTWERGLNILIAIIPEAHGFFSTGEEGVRALAQVAVDASEPAEEVYRVTRAASELSVEEVQAAEKIAAGAHPTPAQIKVAASLEEMTGSETAKAAAPFEKMTADGLEALGKVRQPVKLAGKTHALSLKRVGNQIRVWLCSNGCGELIAKAEAMMAKLPAKSAARGELQKFINQVRKEATWIDELPGDVQAEKQLAEFKETLEGIDKRHPGAVDPDVHVAPAAPAPAEAHAPVPDDAGAAAAEAAHVEPADLDPPGTQYKKPVAGQTGKAGATDIPSWVKDDGYRPPRVGEKGEAYATRLMNNKFGNDWPRGADKEIRETEFSQIKKWADRHFRNE